MGLQYSHEMGILFPVKRLNYFYCHPLPPTTGYPLPLLNHPPSAKGIFGNVQNILGNSIRLPNTLKTYAWESYSWG